MNYDDIDVNIIDCKDTFGVNKTQDTKTLGLTEDNSSKIAKNLFAKTASSKREHENKGPSKMKKYESVFWTSGFESNDLDGKLSAESTYPDFATKVAITFQEKLALLEERDKFLRSRIFKDGSKNMSVIVMGTCPDMCPEKERLLREINCSFSVFEAQVVQNEMLVVPEFLVKEYSRSSADQDEPLPHELRPEPVLIDTMSYMLANIVPKIDESGCDLGEWYHFCWDRLRSLRKDIIQQQLCSPNIVTLLERSARFHICCSDRLFDVERRVFDEKINTENLVNCLQMLITMYEDLQAKGIYCENEIEFRIYMMLLLFDSGDLPDVIRWDDNRVTEATDIFLAFKLKLYTKFFKLVKRASYLNACILQRYFGNVRTQLLNVLVSSYSSGSQTARFPFAFARKVLEFDTEHETISFVENHGFTVHYETGEVRCSKSSFSLPDMKPQCKSSYIVRDKRPSILKAIVGTDTFEFNLHRPKVHSSFNEFDSLKESALFADDQKKEIIKMYGDIYENENEEMKEDLSRREHSPQVPKTSFSFALPLTVHSESDSRFSFCSKGSVETVVTAPQSDFSIFSQPARKDESKQSIDCFTSTETPTHALCVPKLVSKPPVEFPKLIPESPKVLNTDFTDSAFMATEVSSLYDPEDEYESSVDERESESCYSIMVQQPGECFSVRKSEDVADSLSKALNEFERLYYGRLEDTIINEDDDVRRRKIDIFRITKESRRLRKVVKRRLKLKNVKKYARLWKKKWESRKKKRGEFFGIVHLPPEEYFRLWGKAGDLSKRLSTSSTFVQEISANTKTVAWSSKLLNARPLRINFLGEKLAQTVANHARIACFQRGLKMRNVVCWKTLITLPHFDHESYRAFMQKIRELCLAFYYKDNLRLGDVLVTRHLGVKVCTAVYLETNINSVADFNILVGVTSVVLFAHKDWEKEHELEKRLNCIYDVLAYPCFLSLIVIGEYDVVGTIEPLLRKLHQKNALLGWKVIKWKNFFTLPKVIFEACRYFPLTPPFEVKSLATFLETTGSDFFANLSGLTRNGDNQSPTYYIQKYNEFLLEVKRVVCEEEAINFNLALEFLPAICGSEKTSNNLLDKELVTSILSKYTLLNFTKWPPKSIQKMEKLLSEYCHALDTEHTLLANVLRMVDWREQNSIAEINSNTPWLNIVELWFTFNARMVSAHENTENVFIFYDERKIKNIIDRLWTQLWNDNDYSFGSCN